MKKRFLTLALVLALSVSSTVCAFAEGSASSSTNASTDRGGGSSGGGGGGGGGSSVIAKGVQTTNQEGTYAASTSNGTTTITADGATKTSETKEINLNGVNAVYESGTVKGAGIDIELYTTTATIKGVTYTALMSSGTIDGKEINFKIQFIALNGKTVGIVLDAGTELPTKFTGDLTIVIPEGSKKIVHVTNGMFVL